MAAKHRITATQATIAGSHTKKSVFNFCIYTEELNFKKWFPLSGKCTYTDIYKSRYNVPSNGIVTELLTVL
jgi:hypothetical protein